MYISRIVIAALSYLLITFPLAALAQQRSSVTCFTADAWGPAEKPFTTYSQSTTVTELTTVRTRATTTVNWVVPDHTLTVHKRVFRTDWHEEYTDTYTTTIWTTRYDTPPRPTITITATPPPQAQQILSPNAPRDAQEDTPNPEPLGQVLPPEPEEHRTLVNTVICHTVFYTTQTVTHTNYRIVNHGVKRTITLTRTHTEVVDQFAKKPAHTVTTTEMTRYLTYTTTFVIFTPTASTTAFNG